MSLNGTPESFEDELLEGNAQQSALEQQTGEALVTAAYFPNGEGQATDVQRGTTVVAANPELAADSDAVQVQYVQDRGQRIASSQAQGNFFQLRPGDENIFKDEVIQNPNIFQGRSMVEGGLTPVAQQQRREGGYYDPQTGQELDPRTGQPIDRTRPREQQPQVQAVGETPLKQLMALGKASIKPGEPLPAQVKTQIEQLIAQTDRGTSPAMTQLQAQYTEAKGRLDRAMSPQTKAQIQGLDQAILKEINALPPEQKEMASIVFSGYQRAATREGMNQARDQLVKLCPGPTVANALGNRDNLISPVGEQYFAVNQIEGDLRAEKNAPALSRMVYAGMLASTGEFDNARRWLADATAKNRDQEVAILLRQLAEQFKKLPQGNSPPPKR